MTISTVQLTNTFDEWRTITNQIVVVANDFELRFLPTANAAFAKANAANVLANTTNTFAYATAANTTAAFAFANSINTFAYATAANTTAAFAFANSINTFAYATAVNTAAAFTRANTANTIAYATMANTTAAFALGNTVNTFAYSAFAKANAANVLANTANTVAYNTSLVAQAAFDKANLANTDFVSTKIDSAYGHANGAFVKANAAVANTSTVYVGGAWTFGGNVKISGTVDTASANVKSQVLTDVTTVSWDTSLGQIATLTLGGNRSLSAPSNLRIGTYILYIIQDATGSRTLTFPAIVKWSSGVAPPLSTSPGARDIFSFVSDGTNLYGSFIPDVR